MNLSSPQHVVIIDGLSFLFRAYHGVRRGLTKSDGTPTNALFGFAQMLLKVIDDLKPDVCAVALDSVGPTFRKDMYPEYKANRPPPEEDMLIQLRMFQPLVEAFGIPAIRVEGVEADDIIATLVSHYRPSGARVTIVSSDKDLMQLVTDADSAPVKMLDTLKEKWIDEAAVAEKFGVGPRGVVDILALIGDSSDNVPGVPGVGPKTAADLMQQFGTLDALYSRLAEVKRDTLREKLDVNKGEAYLSRQLVRLKDDVALPVGWNELAFAPKVEVAADYLEDVLEFRTLAAKLRKREADRDKAVMAKKKAVEAADEPMGSLRWAPPVQGAVAEVGTWGNYECVQTPDRWRWWLEEAKRAGVVSVDTETTSLDPYLAELAGVSLAIGERSCYVPLQHRTAGGDADLFGGAALLAGQLPYRDVLKDFLALLADPAVMKIGHNLKYDWEVLAKAAGIVPADTGARLQGLVVNFEDTLLLSACLDAGRWGHGLDDLAQRHLGHTMIAYKDVCGTGKNAVTFDCVPLDKATPYAAEDALATLRLWGILKPRLETEEGPRKVYQLIEKLLLPVIVAMEMRGVTVDTSLLRELSDDFGRRMVEFERQIQGKAGHAFNVNSPTQLAVVLFDELKLGTPKQQKNRSTAVNVLEEMADDGVEIAQAMMEYRQLAKLRSTYTETLRGQVSVVTGRVHTNYQQIGAATGRFSSTEPNLQNIPIRTEEGRKVRKAFIPQKGWVMVSADYSQIELRLLAHMSGSEALRKAFTDGADIHAYTASLVNNIPLDAVSKEQRRAAKFINFGLVYGMGAASMAKQIGSTKEEAAAWIAAYFARYDRVKDFMEVNKQVARERGYVETLYGRRVWLPDIRSSNGGLRSNAERAAINAPLQGSNADIIKIAMPKVEQALEGRQARLLMQVHDELVLEAHPDEVEWLKAELPKVMGGVTQLAVSLAVEVGVGGNWDAAH